MAYEAYKESVKSAAEAALKEWRTRDISYDAAIEKHADYWNLQRHHVRELFFKALHYGI